MRNIIYSEMGAIKNLKEPSDMISLFLSYYSTINPFIKGEKKVSYINIIPMFKEVDIYAASENRYKSNIQTWDMCGSFYPENIPLDKVMHGDRLVQQISETFGEGFEREAPTLLITPIPEDDMFIMTNDDKYRLGNEGKTDNEIFKFHEEKYIQFINTILKTDTDQIERVEDYTSDKMKSIVMNSKLMRKVYDFWRESMDSKFSRLAQNVGSLGEFFSNDGNNFRGAMDPGLFAYYSQMSDLNLDCAVPFYFGISSSSSYDYSEKLQQSLTHFIKENMPTYIEKFGEKALDSKKGINFFRIIDLKNNTGQALEITNIITSTDDGPDTIGICAELNSVKNLNNSDAPLIYDRKFLILWEEPKDHVILSLKNSCDRLYDCVFKNIWDDMDIPVPEAAPVVPAESTAAPVVPAESTAAPVVPAESTAAPVVPAESTAAPVVPAESTAVPVAPAESTAAPVAPAESTAAPVVPAESTAAPVAPAESTAAPVVPAESTNAPVDILENIEGKIENANSIINEFQPKVEKLEGINVNVKDKKVNDSVKEYINQILNRLGELTNLIDLVKVHPNDTSYINKLEKDSNKLRKELDILELTINYMIESSKTIAICDERKNLVLAPVKTEADRDEMKKLSNDSAMQEQKTRDAAKKIEEYREANKEEESVSDESSLQRLYKYEKDKPSSCKIM